MANLFEVLKAKLESNNDFLKRKKVRFKSQNKLIDFLIIEIKSKYINSLERKYAKNIQSFI